MTGHRRGAVVQNKNRYLRLVIYRVDQAGNTGVQECGITDNRHYLIPDASLFHTLCLPDAGTHTAGGIQSIVRGKGTQRVAANIAGND